MQLNNETYIKTIEEDIVTSYICSIVDKVLIVASGIATIVAMSILALILKVARGGAIETEYIIGVVAMGCISGAIITIIPSDENLRYQVISKIINRKKDK